MLAVGCTSAVAVFIACYSAPHARPMERRGLDGVLPPISKIKYLRKTNIRRAPNVYKQRSGTLAYHLAVGHNEHDEEHG